MFMGSSCWLMPSRWFLDIASETIIRCLDFVANVTAFFYLLSLYQRFFPGPEDQTHMDQFFFSFLFSVSSSFILLYIHSCTSFH